MLDRTDLARDEAINEAFSAAIDDANADGIPRADAFAHHLAKHGLMVVEASKWDAAKTALQVVGSFPITHPTENMDAANMATVAVNALKKMEL
jgi:hypothetical protein